MPSVKNIWLIDITDFNIWTSSTVQGQISV